jgi:putative phosphoribosyl transferase
MELADELSRMDLQQPVVLALPRGGVPVGFEVARKLQAPLDLLVVRKVGTPANPELAAAAIVDGDPPDVVVNEEVLRICGLDETELARLIDHERPELERRRRTYGTGRGKIDIKDRAVILVDDGAATGTTMKAAIRALRRRAPSIIIVALPVAPTDTVAALAEQADAVVCLSQPADFQALGYHYQDFPQLSDEEITYVLKVSDGLATSFAPKHPPSSVPEQ